MWKCVCDCGTERTVRALSLLSVNGVRSCGCLQRDVAKQYQLIHGHSRKKNWTPEYRAWAHMMNRCVNPKDFGYRNYGGRGIQVCESWKTFENFLKDVGLRPSPKFSIDRINNNGNYEPGNVRWATKRQQCRNRRGLHLLTYDGKTQCLSDWADEIGSERELIRSRIRSGWSAERALFTPKRNA